MAVPQAAEIEALSARLIPGYPRLPLDNPRTDRIYIPWTYVPPLFLVHLMIVSPFLAPETALHMMQAKAATMGMTQRVAPFLNWLRAARIDPLQGIAALSRMDLVDTTLSQRHKIRTRLFLPPSLPIPL